MNPIIDIQHVSRTFGRTQALQDVSLRLERGRVLGLIGENGAGKTTLLKHILGLLRPQNGSVAVFGLDPSRNPKGVLSRIGYLAEDDWLPLWMRIHQIQDYYRGLYPTWDQAYAEELRGRFGLDTRAKLSELSKGQRARAGLMIALAYRPDLLVFDEPSSGLDSLVRREILTTIIRAISDENRTVIFSSHLLGEVEQIADDVAMIQHGRLVLADSLEAIKERFHRYVIELSEPVTRPPITPGCMAWRGSRTTWECVSDRPVVEVHQAVASTGGRVCETETLTLEDIFFARSTQEASFV